MKSYGSKRTYAGCRVVKVAGRSIKIEEGSPKNHKRGRLVGKEDISEVDDEVELLRPPTL